MTPDIDINRLRQHCDAEIAHARLRYQFGNDMVGSVTTQYVMSIIKFECERDDATAETIWSRVITEIGTSLSPSSSAIRNEINRQLTDTWRALFCDIVDGCFAGDDEVKE